MIYKPPSAYHFHTCVVCRRRYGDTCATREHNGKCNRCISGLPSIYSTGFDPIACCRSECRRANKEEIKAHKLAGPGPWWICRTCSRTHGHNPQEDA